MKILNVLFLCLCVHFQISGKNYTPGKSRTCRIFIGEDSTLLFAKGAKPILVSNQFGFTEGPSVDKTGNVFFTDQPNDKIWKYDTEGKLTVFADRTGRANGTYFDSHGNLLTCSDEQNMILSFSKGKSVSLRLKDYEGKKFNGPNDLWLDKKDNIYFTDPYYQRSYWQRKSPEIPEQDVYFLKRGEKQAVQLISDLIQPNGIVGSADGKYLFVSDIAGGKTYRYAIQSEGVLVDKQLFVEQGSDGMTLDARGNLYLTGKDVTVYNPSGKLIARIEIPEPSTSNLCFGGSGKDILFITAGKSVYILKMNVRGIE